MRATGLSVAELIAERRTRGREQKELADQDSNLDKQNQNLLCYRYTIGQERESRTSKLG